MDEISVVNNLREVCAADRRVLRAEPLHWHYRLSVGRMKAWKAVSSSAETRTEYRLQDSRMVIHPALEEVRVTKPSMGPVLHKVWAFEDEAVDLVLTLSHEAHKNGS